MDRLVQCSYEKDFCITFLKSKGDSFQHFFETLMSKAYPNDFIACRPWGKIGDRKNDGYLFSARILFQIYAPNEMTAVKAIKKINDDFSGAKEHWEQYLGEWIFVHNAFDGRLPPHIVEELLKLRKNNIHLKIGHWGYEELLKIFQKLDLIALESWFGPPITTHAANNLGFEDIAVILKHITTFALKPIPSDVKEVSQGKIEANLLSPAVSAFLRIGMQKSFLVNQFFNSWRDPLYGEQIATAFKKKYIELTEVVPAFLPDEIFSMLELWVGGNNNNHTPTHKLAVLTILAYFFDKCEIFKDAKIEVMS